METLKLVRVTWISIERDKYVWGDLYRYSRDEIIGRMYVLKAHSLIEDKRYDDLLTTSKEI